MFNVVCGGVVVILFLLLFSGVPPTTPGVDERPTDVTPGTGTATTGTGPLIGTTETPGNALSQASWQVKCVLQVVLFSSAYKKNRAKSLVLQELM